MALNQSGWRPEALGPGSTPAATGSVTGNKALMLEEALIFEIGDTSTTGVDFSGTLASPAKAGAQLRDAGNERQHSPTEDGATGPRPAPGNRLNGLERSTPIGLPGLSEPETVRHYTRLSRQNYGIDLGFFPLGSCTMKHNPRLNERIARLPGFADVHPLQPVDTVQGALRVINELAVWLIALTGMHGVAMSPKAGAHGELCGILCIKAALEARGEGHRKVVLVPESAHGTNPATAAFAGFAVEDIPANADGRVDLDALKARLGPDVAAVMVTNPNTCGLFERDMKAISDAVHAAGGYVYCDGANFNAIVGRVRPGDLGIDAMHINLHKTFSTPHGGGGPGSGPVVLSEALSPFGPLPFTARHADGHIELVEEETAGEDHPDTFGRMTAFHGQMGMFTRALTYILSHGADGLRQVAEDAVLNANYILRSLEGTLDAPFARSGPCMHEALFSDDNLAEGFSTIDIAKGLIDEGFHPMTVYFPLVVHGAMLVEPTETESKAAIDQFVGALRSVAERAKAGDPALKSAPHFAPRARLDETLAARRPVLVWRERELAPAAESGRVQIHQAEPGWQQYVVMLVVFGIVLGLRARRLMKVRPLKPERLWVVPVLYFAVVAVLFARVPPSPTGWLLCVVALVLGGAAGWQRGKTMAIHVDPATGRLMQRGSIWALVTIAALVAVKLIAQTEGRAWHFDANLLVDALAAFTLGLFAAQRLEMYQRATALLRAARG